MADCFQQQQNCDVMMRYLGSEINYFEEEDVKFLKRSSSLKKESEIVGKKKIVRFADVLGLDLVELRTFLDEIPRVPPTAFLDLVLKEEDNKRHKKVVVSFHQPVSQLDFMDRVAKENVVLENAWAEDNVVKGTVRVKNLNFCKNVVVRFTVDEWGSFGEEQCWYVRGDAFTDLFSFKISHTPLEIGERLSLCLRFDCQGQQYWDNNHGSNYTFHAVPC